MAGPRNITVVAASGTVGVAAGTELLAGAFPGWQGGSARLSTTGLQ